MMLRIAIALLAFAVALPAATIRLYLKDGGFHNVREYEKKADRVRYYSTERGDWEEIPLELVDLKKTQDEATKRETEQKQQARLMDAEEKAERTEQREIAAIPYEAGVFQVSKEQATTLKSAETKVVNNKRRSILKAMSPIPIVSGKSTVEIDGLKASHVVPPGQPEFYIRLSGEERFEIAKVAVGKAARIVQHWDLIPVTKEIVEKTEIRESFKQQLAEGLYKIWPVKALEPGEYAVIQYTEGKGNIQVWDFSVSR